MSTGVTGQAQIRFAGVKPKQRGKGKGKRKGGR